MCCGISSAANILRVEAAKRVIHNWGMFWRASPAPLHVDYKSIQGELADPIVSRGLPDALEVGRGE
jgi:hypothetical protein